MSYEEKQRRSVVLPARGDQHARCVMVAISRVSLQRESDASRDHRTIPVVTSLILRLEVQFHVGGNGELHAATQV